MPLSFNLTRREFLICQKARKEGIRLTVKFNEETRPIPLAKGVFSDDYTIRYL